jgi:hypothetical protein
LVLRLFFLNCHDIIKRNYLIVFNDKGASAPFLIPSKK